MNRSSLKTFFPYLALAAGIFALGISPFFARWADPSATGPVFAFYRMFTAAIVLLPFFAREQRQAATRLSWGLLIFPILGGLANAFDLTLWFTAIRYTRLANATLMNNIAPLWVALFAWLVLKEKLRPVFWIGLLVALVGAGVVLGTDLFYHPSLNLGNFIGVGSSLFYAIYYLITQRGRQRLSAMQYSYFMTISSGVITLVVSLAAGLKVTGFSWPTYLAFIGAGVVTQSIGFLSLSYSLGRIPASLVSATMILQPVLSALLAIPLLGEPLEAGQWVGGLAVLGGIYMVNRGQEVRTPAVERAITE